MAEDIYVQPESLNSWAGIHDGVSTGLSQLTGAGPAASSNVATSHGLIASGVNNALSGVVGSREGTLQTAVSASDAIKEILKTSVKLYEQGDEEGAAKLKAAAAALEQSQGGAGSTGTGSAEASGGSSGAGGGGDMASQIGQGVGAAAQAASQTIAGMVQGLAAIPGQVMQGVQGIVQTATQAGAGGAEAAGAQAAGQPGEATGRPGEADGRPGDERPDERGGEREREPREGRDQQGAQPTEAEGRGGQSAPPVEKPQPAQTRPAGDVV